jgi:hypothetical protein
MLIAVRISSIDSSRNVVCPSLQISTLPERREKPDVSGPPRSGDCTISSPFVIQYASCPLTVVVVNVPSPIARFAINGSSPVDWNSISSKPTPVVPICGRSSLAT